MSDQRPEWLPDFLPNNWPPGSVTEDYYRTGLRAQIAVLEEVVPTVCHRCEVGVKLYPSRLSDLRPFHASPDGDRLCKAGSLHSKIAALRKELE